MSTSQRTQRGAFEAWVSSPPLELSVERTPDDPERHAWPGQYVNYPTHLAWDAWQAGAQYTTSALSRAVVTSGDLAP